MREESLKYTNPKGYITKAAIPIALLGLVSVLQSLVGMSTTSGISSDALIAVVAVDSLRDTLGSFTGLSLYTMRTQLAKYLGRGDYDAVRRILKTTINSSLFLTAGLSVVALVIMIPALALVGIKPDSGDVFKYAITYYLIVTVPLLILNEFNGFMAQYFSKTLQRKVTSNSTVLKDVAQIALAVTLTPIIGIVGAALAVVVATLLRSLYYVFYLFTTEEIYIELNLRDISFKKFLADLPNVAKGTVRVASSFSRNSLYLTFVALLNAYNPALLPFFSLACKLERIAITSVGAFAEMSSVYAGVLIGDKRISKAVEGVKFARRVVGIGSTGIMLAILALSPILVGVFLEPELVEGGYKLFTVTLIAFTISQSIQNLGSMYNRLSSILGGDILLDTLKILLTLAYIVILPLLNANQIALTIAYCSFFLAQGLIQVAIGAKALYDLEHTDKFATFKR